MTTQMIQTFTLNSWNVRTCVANGIPYFAGKDVATALGYKNHSKTINDHVFEEDRVTLDNFRGNVELLNQKLKKLRGASETKFSYNARSLIYITEAGLYALIFGSQKAEAREFKRWVCQQVLPHLRKSLQSQQCPPLSLRNETDLHYKVVDAIRRFYPHAIIAPGLGELQDSVEKRRDGYFKGYTGGQPDILILNCHSKWRGLALELKTPQGTGKLSFKQDSYLDSLQMSGFLAICSDDYDAILLKIFEYFQKVRLICTQCSKKFCTEATLEKHMYCFHKSIAS